MLTKEPDLGTDGNIHCMLRVLAIVPCPFVAGLQIITLGIFGRLSNSVESHFLLSRWTDGEFARRLNELGLRHSDSCFGLFSRKLDPRNLRVVLGCLVNLPILYRDYLLLVRRFKPNLIYMGNYQEIMLLWPLLLLVRIPVVYHVHGTIATGSFCRLSHWFWGRAVDRCIAVSKSVRDSLQLLGVPPDEITVLYNGVDLDSFRAAPVRTDRFAARFDWPPDSIIIGMTGQMYEAKGHRDFLEAARVTYTCDPNARFVIGGLQTQPFAGELERQVSSLGLGSVVKFSGWQDDMTDFYSALDIMVFPTRHAAEGFPLTIVEAMAAGLPVVATESGGAVEAVEHGVTGILVDRQSPLQLAHTLNVLVNSPTLRQSMGQAGRRRASAHFDLACQIKKFEEILLQIVRQHAH